MSDQNNEIEVPATESREGRRARQIKADVMDLMEDVVVLMERARAEGFLVEFSVHRDAEGRNFINNDLLKVIKVW